MTRNSLVKAFEPVLEARQSQETMTVLSSFIKKA